MEPITSSVFVSPGIFDLCALGFVPLRCLGLQGRSSYTIFLCTRQFHLHPPSQRFIL